MLFVSATHLSAASENGLTRKIGNGVYTFTILGANYSMFIVRKDSVAIMETFSSDRSRKQHVGLGVITIDELGSGTSNGTEPIGLPAPMSPDTVATAKLAGASFDRPDDDAPSFKVGDTLPARLISPTGHCRRAAYVEGCRGQIMTYHGAHVVADASAHNEKVSEPLYTLRFQLSEL
jgi:hypothetical protein